MSLLRIFSWSIFAGMAVHLATLPHFASAQEPAKDGDGKDTKILVAVINVTKTVGMSKAPGAADEPIIEKVQNENPKVVRIQSIFNDPRHVLITGLAPGTSRVTFTGYTDPNQKDRHDEVFEVRVVSDDSILREQLRKDFLILVRKVAPTANIDVTVVFSTTAGPVMVSTTSGTNTPDSVNRTGVTDNRMVAFLTGNVMSADVVNTILESARAMFGNNVQIVNQMTVGGVQQVEVDCVICSIKRTRLRQMSFSWALNRRDFFLTSILPGSAGVFSNAIVPGIGASSANSLNTGGNLIFGSVNDSGAFLAFLQALRTDGLAKVQAEPKVVTLSGRPAQFISGGTVPTISTSIGGSQVQQTPFGTTVTVLPIVLGNGKIHLEIAPQISTPDPTLSVSTTQGAGGGGNNAPGFRSQGAQVAVQLEDGQTMAIGGLISHKTEGTLVKVPVLGDVPFVGAAFRSVRYNEEEEELIILVTPRLVDPMGCDQLPGRLPTRLTRNPDDFELYLEGVLELPRGPRQTCGPNGCYQAPHLMGPTAGMFPCGDQGRCGHNGLLGHRGACGPDCGKNGVCPPGCTTSAPASVPGSVKAGTITGLPSADQVIRGSTEQSITIATPPTDLPVSNVAPASYRATPMPTGNGPALRAPAVTGLPE